MYNTEWRKNKRDLLLRNRRNGMVTVYVALGLMVFLGMAGLAVDVGHLYHNRAKAQRAADAAALAGALQFASGYGKTEADTNARSVATANGYNVVASNVTMTTSYPAIDDQTGATKDSWYRVQITRTEPLFFLAALGFRNLPVGAKATAEYRRKSPIPIQNGVPDYTKIGNTNLSLFGPWAAHSNGDMWSTLKNNNGTSNGTYKEEGMNFLFSIPSNYWSTSGTAVQKDKMVSVEIFDPDCYNLNGAINADGINTVDELRNSPFSGHPQATTTQYTLLYNNGTPLNPNDDIEIATKTYGADSSTDRKWVQPSGFSFDVTDSRWSANASLAGAFRINAKTIDGSSENGFDLHVGKPHAAGTNPLDTPMININADGVLPINFNRSGTTTINLGSVPPNATSVTVGKFDTDTGATSVTYSDGNTTYTGVLTGNDEFRADKFILPAGYAGGTWTATYSSGVQDTTSWSMDYTGTGLGGTSSVILVR